MNACSLLEDAIAKWKDSGLEEVIEQVNRYFDQTSDALDVQPTENVSELLNRVHSGLTNLPDMSAILEKVEKAMNVDPKKLELLEAMRQDVESLKIGDGTIEKIRNQIKEVEQRRDERIKELRITMNEKMDKQKEVAIRGIEQSIEACKNEIDRLQQALACIYKEIDTTKSAIDSLAKKEREDSEKFENDNKFIEDELIQVKSKLDNLESQNLSEKKATAETTLSKLERECELRTSRLKALKLDLELASSTRNTELEEELRVLEDKLHELEKDLAAAPTLEQWNQVKLQLNRQETHHHDENSLSHELSHLRAQKQRLTNDLLRLTNSVQETNKTAAVSETDIERLRQQCSHLQSNPSEDVIVDVLKEQRQRIQDVVTSKECEIQNLQKERLALEGRIQYLRKEKESIIDMAHPSHTSKDTHHSMSPPERLLVRIIGAAVSNNVARAIVLGYLLLLHILFFIVITA